MKLLDFSKWQKVKEDKKSVDLEHPDGHKMTIATQGLPKIQQEQIKRLKLADGGKVKNFAAGGMSDDDSAPDNSAALAAPAQAMDTSTPQVASGGTGVQQEASKTLGGIGQEQQGLSQQKDIDIQKAKAQATNEDAYLKQRQAIAQQDQDHYNEIKGHTDDFKDYINNNPVNPMAYQENMGTGQKVATALGLLFGGFKQGYNGGSNAAMDYLMSQQDKDIAAQQQRANNQKTVWGAYQQLYGDSNVATSLAKVSANDLLSHKANLVAAQLGTPQAIATNNLLQGKLMQDSDEKRMNAAGALGDNYRRNGAASRQPGQQNQPNNGSSHPGQTNAKTNGSTGSYGDNTAQQDAAPIITPILHAGAEKMYQGLQYTPKAKDQIPEITRQYTQAQQADKALGDIGKTFNNLTDETTFSGRIRRSVSPHAVAGITAGIGGALGAAGGPIGIGAGASAGAALGEGLGHMAQAATNTDTNRQYDSDKSALLGYVSAALKGTNIGGGQIDDIVSANSPEYGDSKATLNKKLANIQDFIKNHTETSLLKTWHLSNH
jgi:hypothetical protein